MPELTGINIVIKKSTRAERVGLSFHDEGTVGVTGIISRIAPGGLAGNAGLCEGDRVVFMSDA